MKKLLIISVVAVSALLTSCATTFYGIKAGPNIANIYGDDVDNAESKIGVLFGGYAEFQAFDTFSIQPELLYSAQGAKYTESDGFDGKFKLDYLNIPIMGKFYVSDGFFLEAGPQIGFLLSAKDEYESPGLSGEDDIKEFFKGTDFAANLGLGYQLEGGLNFGARYSVGVSNINDFEGSEDFKNTNGVFSFLVGFRF